MELEVQPMPAEDELSAIRSALVRAGIQLDHPPAAYVERMATRSRARGCRGIARPLVLRALAAQHPRRDARVVEA